MKRKSSMTRAVRAGRPRAKRRAIKKSNTPETDIDTKIVNALQHHQHTPIYRYPSINDCPYIQYFPGLQCYQMLPDLPFNRFELELIEPQSTLNNIFANTFRQSLSLDVLPDLNFMQLTILALLSSPIRTLTVKDIVEWILINFPVIHRTADQQAANKVPSQDAIYRTIWDNVLAYVCMVAESYYLNDLVLVGSALSTRQLKFAHPWPEEAMRLYYLPYGVEDRVFEDKFIEFEKFGWYGLTPPPPHKDAKRRITLSDLPRSIKFKIVSEVLSFPHPVNFHFDEVRKGPIVSIQESPRVQLNLPVPPELLALFSVNKDFREIAEFAFYSTNTFICYTSKDTFNLLRIFLGRIGPRGRALIRSIDANLIIQAPWSSPRAMGESFQMLGESHCLQFLTLHMNMMKMDKFGRGPISEIPGFSHLARFRGVNYANVLNCPGAQIYLDRMLSITAMHQGDRFHGPALEVLEGLEGSVIPRFDEVLQARPGVNKYFGADMRILGPGLGHGPVYTPNRLAEEARGGGIVRTVPWVIKPSRDVSPLANTHRVGGPWMGPFSDSEPREPTNAEVLSTLTK